MASQYTDQYLDRCETERVTVGTFLAQHLRGKAKQYSGSYYHALMRDLCEREMRGEIRRVRSLRGGEAFVRVPEEDREDRRLVPCAHCGKLEQAGRLERISRGGGPWQTYCSACVGYLFWTPYDGPRPADPKEARKT